MRKLVYRPAALTDLDAIFDFIQPENPRRAASYITDIRKKCRTLLDHPMKGPPREDLAPGIRILSMFRRIIVAYRVSGDEIVITRIFSGGQDYEAILRDDDTGA